MGRLISETEGSDSIVYEYDGFGNRSKMTAVGSEPSETGYAYDLRNLLQTNC